MKNAGIAFIIGITLVLSLFTPAGAAASNNRNITVYIPKGTSLTTERIIYNALSAAGIVCNTEERLSGMDSFEAMHGRSNALAAGISDYTWVRYADEVAKVDIPIGKVEYVAYTRADSDISIYSWKDTQGLTVGILEDSNYIMSQIQNYVASTDFDAGFDMLINGATDVFIATIYDNVAPLLPKGVKHAGIMDTAETFCWYNANQPEIGDILRIGLDIIQENGVLNRIKAGKSTNPNTPGVIFQLSSYSNEMIWENQAEQTLRDTLAAREHPASLHIYNMNFRRTNYRSAQYEATTDFARATFMTEYPGVIIAMDNDALGYLQENYRRYFYGVPVVFCGINGFNPDLISEFAEFATGINEYIDPTETVEFALAHNPGLKEIYMIFDETSSASPVKAAIMAAVAEKYGSRLEVTSCGDQTFEEIVTEVQSFDEDTMVLIGTYFSDKDGHFMPESEVAERLTQAADIPVYSLMSGYLGYGVVGGRVAYSKAFIAEAAQMALRVLEGEDVKSIPIIGNIESEARFNTFLVDKQAADRFGVNRNLYASATLLNADMSVFQAYPVPSAVGVCLIFITVITSALGMMLMHSKHSQEAAERNAEHEKENNRMKSDFLARMSHEIRTPLNAIIGMDELILREEIPPSVHQSALVILHSGRSLLSIINDILDFSKIESGKLEMVMTDFDVGSLIYDTVSMIRVRAADKPIEVRMDVAKDFPAFLYGDEVRVRQVLLNFLTNAVKYTNEGTITLKAVFEFDPGRENAGAAVYTVSDTGIGIKEEDLSRLFEAFTQVDTKTNRRVEGTGLGLSITKTLVEMMGGSIEVRSEFGRGSEFIARISHEVHHYKPLGDISAAFNKRVEEDGKQQYIRFTAPNAHILAVDDVAANLMVITGLLAPYEIKIDTVTGGAAAMEAVQKTHYDFIFMDHMMPEMDGVEATKNIRAMEHEKYKDIPIIALTANAISGMREMFLENGFSDFISKPIETNELDKMMHKWIPKEKRIATAKRSDEREEAAKGLYSVEGIDVTSGLKRFRGKAESYERILRLFAKDLNKSLDSLADFLAAEQYEELRLSLHSIKGMSGNVDCTEVFEMSKNLDNAIRVENYAYVHEHLAEFMAKAEDVALSIGKNLGE